MSNNTNKNFNLPSPEELKTEVEREPLVVMGRVGNVWSAKLSDICTQVANIIADQMGLPELIDIFCIADYDRNAGNLTENTKCFAIFDTKSIDPKASNIWLNGRRGGGNDGGRQMAVDISSHSGNNGRFATSDKFKEVMVQFAKDSTIEYLDGDRVNIIVREHPENPNLPIVELDFQKILQAALNVNSEFINYSVIGASPIGNDDFNVMALKYIDTSAATRRNRGRRGLDITALRNGIARRYGRGGNRNQNGGGRRNF